MMQSLPLSLKVTLTKARIRQWYNEFDGNVYVSFSGGKDSTVLLHIVREMYKDVEAVFVDTGLEYPEIREFVHSFINVIWLKPKMTFKQVCQKYGYPFIGKEVSTKIYECRSKPNGYASKSFNGEKSGMFDYSKYKSLLSASFPISAKCCNVMKKNPCKSFEHETGKKAIIGQMASESQARTKEWLLHGCNAFDKKRQVSNPMSFWTEQDILHYVYENHIEICSVYRDIVPVQEIDGQMELSLDGECVDTQIGETTKLQTTGCNRTGCMFCGYGCHLEKPGQGRFEMMKETHPKQYDFIMKPESEGGLGYKEKIDEINRLCGTDIRY